MWAINSPDFRQRVATLASGTTRKRISRRNLSSLTLPVPPLEEQRRIVDALEGHLSRLDAAERELHGAAGRLARLRDQVIRHALFPSSPLTTPSAVPLPDVGVNDGELPDLPNNWHWARLGELSEVVGGVTKDSSKQGDPTFVEVPYLRVANVQRGRLDLDVITKIRVPPDKAAKLELLPGDVLLNEGGDRDKLGRGWVWDGQIEQCIHQNHVFRARIRDGVLTPKLLSWAANSFGGRWCERNGKQSVNLASISLSKIRLMPVPVPPLGEQPAIERQIQAGLDGCDRLAASLAIARRESRALRRSLLGAAFTGGLSAAPTATDPREAAHV
jgi:type I restriction enzyme S subunit